MHRYLSVTLILLLAACGGGSSSDTAGPSATPTPTPVPQASVSATGAGLLVIHPSASGLWALALSVPLQITETGGGTADWTYARMSLLQNGFEIERSEVGSSTIISNGYGRITARSNTTVSVVFHFNSPDFNGWTVTLGFADVNSGRTFEVAVPQSSFDGVDISFIPLSRPVPFVGRLD